MAIKYTNKTDQEETVLFLESLRTIKRRPAMYFGKEYEYRQLAAFIFGYLTGANLLEHDRENTVAKIHQEVNHRLFMKYSENNGALIPLMGREPFNDYFKILDEVLDEYYPEYK